MCSEPRRTGRQQFPGLCKNLIKHLSGQSPRLGVLLTGVIGTNQCRFIIQAMAFTVSELRSRLRHGPSELFPGEQICPPGDPSQNHYHTDTVQKLQFSSEVVSASVQFLKRRFVAWWHTVESGRNSGVQQAQPVFPVLAGWLITKSEPVEGFKKKVPTPVSCEHSTRAIGSMGTWGQPQDEHVGMPNSQRGNRFPPVGAVLECAPLLPGHPLPILYQAGAKTTSHNLFLNFADFACHVMFVLLFWSTEPG